MSQSSDNSRTFRVLNLTDEVKAQLTDAVVTQHENVHYVEVVDVSKIANVKKAFDDAEIKYKQCSYSTFVRFTDSMTIDDLNKVNLKTVIIPALLNGYEFKPENHGYLELASHLLFLIKAAIFFLHKVEEITMNFPYSMTLKAF